MTIDMDLSEFHGVFFEECFEGLDIAEAELLKFNEGSADPETINTIFRAIHSIKGGGATFNFSELSEFAHVMETLLDEIRNDNATITPETVNLLLESTDCLREIASATKSQKTIDNSRIDSLKKQLGDAMGQASESPIHNKSHSSTHSINSWQILFLPHQSFLHTGNDPYRLLRELSTLGELTSSVDVSNLPDFPDLDPETCYLSWELTLTGEVTLSQVKEVFAWVEEDCELEIIPLDRKENSNHIETRSAAKETSEAAAPPSPAPDSIQLQDSINKEDKKPEINHRKPVPAQESSSIRVSIDKLDALVNLVGELVITQSMLNCFANGDANKDYSDKLHDNLNQLMRNTRELQEAVMRIRMLPISACFNRFPRLVHDLSGKLNKKVKIKLSGEQTELDKTVLEKINDPLVHLVRNSLDHGLETPEIRRSAGKPETGTLHLNAYHEGGNIVIEASDDGAGLNKEKILTKAKEKGLINEDSPLTEEQIQNLIFHPGFSTADQISDVSGRGVGMDVVKRNIQDLGGQIQVSSIPGEGTRFTIRLPLTLAILDGQLVKVGEETYIIPLVSIIESLQIKAERINSIAGATEVYQMRDCCIPIIRLHEIFNQQPCSIDLQQGLLVVVETEQGKMGLFVDDLLGQQQIVIKSLEDNYQQVPGLSGATILGDGQVALILDVSSLLQISYGRCNQRPARLTAV